MAKHLARGLLRTIDPWERAEGAPGPLGVTWVEDHAAYNFALYSRYATAVTLLAYHADDLAVPVFELRLNHLRNKTGRIWHCWVPAADLNGATLYAYQVDGPRDPDAGHRYDPDKILLDPYAPAVFFPPGYSRAACSQPGSSAGRAPLGVLPRREPRFVWGKDERPRHTHDAVIYELHVKGFTARANSGVAAERRGTFAGLMEKIPYLKELGVTVVELLPVQQFDPDERNYWGYMTLHFFSPHCQYASGDAFDEFRVMVKAFHEAGIEVWLDVVYNHTSEGNEQGPTYSFRGFDNLGYYLLAPDRRYYNNDTGCGNTLRCGHPSVRSLVVRSLRFWIEEMHVDGFRFDLASILSRDSEGRIDGQDPALITEIGAIACLADVRLAAETWDVTTYQLGRSFPGLTWLQWNDRYRNDVRAFVKSDPGKVGALMQRLYGSDDVFPDDILDTCRPYQSINFVTAHDGFCLHDLVAYNEKHNAANGHGNTDGSNHNLSWNCGWEGEDGAPDATLELRRRQAKNFCALLMLASGTPMFAAGDEFLNTQRGNNNPYNQDNEVTWIDWDRLAEHQDVFRFFRLMIAFRKAHPSIGRSRFWREDVSWHGVGARTDLSYDSRALAYCLRGASVGDDDLYVLINAYWEDLDFTIEVNVVDWLRVVDTGRPSPEDILEPGTEPPLASAVYRVRARSIVVLRRPRGA